MASIRRVCSADDERVVIHNFQKQSILIVISVDAHLEVFALFGEQNYKLEFSQDNP